MTNDKKDTHPRKRRSCLRFFVKSLVLLVVLVLLGGAIAGVAGYLVYDHVTRPGIPGEPVSITIPEGLTGGEVGVLLAGHGLVEHELFFRLAIRLDDSGRPIKHGYYALPTGLSPLEILHHLQEGTQWRADPKTLRDELRITIPEGLSIEQMSSLFDDSAAFKEAAADPALIARLGLDVPNLEGFLMPNTYFFSEKPSEQAVVERMFEQFKRDYTRLVREFPDAAQRDLLEVVTIASLIERESRVEEERPLVAAVIYNRLAKGMPLELDCTLQFALNKYGERMLHEDKETDSPYNTYKYRGLPPGPICSPGVACLRAALNPADADYLFFVSNADGRTHTFSRTMAEHLEAVRRYRRDIAVQRRALREREAAGDSDESQ